jgi:hypothetical protein
MGWALCSCGSWRRNLLHFYFDFLRCRGAEWVVLILGNQWRYFIQISLFRLRRLFEISHWNILISYWVLLRTISAWINSRNLYNLNHTLFLLRLLFLILHWDSFFRCLYFLKLILPGLSILNTTYRLLTIAYGVSFLF